MTGLTQERHAVANWETEAVIEKVTRLYAWFAQLMAVAGVLTYILLRDVASPWGWVAAVLICAGLLSLIPISRAEALVRRELEKRENTNG
jgi:hypothetical protein